MTIIANLQFFCNWVAFCLLIATKIVYNIKVMSILCKAAKYGH